ncbi:S1C family serine protease [Spongiimicrobium salis]|uniref:S1C family serine protease n=1 Tax=Spongiimicrobium salis TaxID=1667022 RepID=UPI00374D85AA
MKKLGSLLLVAVFAGAITLGAYKLFFEEPNYTIVSQSPETPVFSTNYTPVSAKGAGINEVDFTLAAEKTVNAVVHVKNIVKGKKASSLRELFYGSGQTRPSVGTGSGVIISPDGYIVTNNHVIDKATKLQVTLNNNKIYDAELVGTDAKSDIALLKIDADTELPYLAFGDSDNTKIGEWVLAVGNPFNLTSTVTAGIVSAKARNLDFSENNQSFIQTDAAVNPGNSGGALVNTNGDLVGINTAITSQTGTFVGYSFAVPSNIAKKVIDDIIEYGDVQRGILGISAVIPFSPQGKELGVDQLDGVYVGSVEEESGADDAGLKEGDVIKKIDRVKVHKFADLTGYISSKRLGEKVNVTVERASKTLVLPVTIKARQSAIIPMGNIEVEIRNLTEKDKKLYKVDNGVKITRVAQRFQSYNLEGKLLVAIDDEEITDINHAAKLFGNISKYGTNSITMVNEDGEIERLVLQ